MDEKKTRERLMTAAVIVLAALGILYFGFRAVRDHSKRISANPFEYDIKNFKITDPSLVHFSETGRIPLNLEKASGLAVGPGDGIYVSGDRSLLVFNRDGTSRESFETGDPVRCLAVEGNGNVYLGYVDHIDVYGRNGAFLSGWESMGEEAIFTSVAVSQDFVFVADAGNQIVWKFDKSGKRLARVGGEDETKDIPGFVIPSPFFDVAVDPEGFLWAANTGRHSLENYTLDGDFRSSWGEFSMDIGGFCGCCNPTHFAFLEDGSFVTSEKGIVRIKVYNRLGDLVSVVAGPESFAEGTVGLDLAVDSARRILVLDPHLKMVRIYEKTQDR